MVRVGRAAIPFRCATGRQNPTAWLSRTIGWITMFSLKGTAGGPAKFTTCRLSV
jgi:hypothetical protein